MADEEPAEIVKVFINHVDTFTGNAISKILAKSAIGGTTEENDENQSQLSVQDSILVKEDCYQVVGTLKDDDSPRPDWVSAIYEYDQKEELLVILMTCDIIIYDIATDANQVEEATWVVSALNSEIANFHTSKVFICISNVLTWGRTKPLDPDDGEMPFTEEDYRKRKAHPNFKSHLSCEKLTIKHGKTNKSKLMTYVVAGGLLYGEGENLFHFLFKSSWLGDESGLHIYGNGQNVLPTIHIRDLASIIVNVCDSKPKVRYILAVDDANSTLEDIVRCVSKNLGNNKAKFVSREDALLENEVTQVDYDMLQVNIRMDATVIKESMVINWVAESGLPDNIAKVIKEYREHRNLLPLRACIVGPPASGKSTVIKQLCDHYNIHHIMVQDVIDDAITKLKVTAARADEEIEDEEDDMRAQDNQKMLDDINESKEKNNGRLEDHLIIQFFKERLHSMQCQNQGFILDGYPKTMDQARELFAISENEDEMDDRDQTGEFDDLIMPEFMISLDASDEYLRNRVMNLPEKFVTGTHNTEEGLQRRLVEYRSVNTDDETVLNFFDELEIHPEHIDIANDHTPNMRSTVDRIIQLMGKPRNYGPTSEEIAEMERMGIAKEMDEKKRKQDEIEKEEAEEARDRAKKLEEWRARLNEVKQQEEEMLETQSIPLRNYLMKHVMPTLTQGLIECCKVRPDDPVDFLAEFLFEQNPQVNI